MVRSNLPGLMDIQAVDMERPLGESHRKEIFVFVSGICGFFFFFLF